MFINDLRPAHLVVWPQKKRLLTAQSATRLWPVHVKNAGATITVPKHKIYKIWINILNKFVWLDSSRPSRLLPLIEGFPSVQFACLMGWNCVCKSPSIHWQRDLDVNESTNTTDSIGQEKTSARLSPKLFIKSDSPQICVLCARAPCWSQISALPDLPC